MPKTLYAVRKHRGQWAIFCSGAAQLEFSTYREAIETARRAASFLAHFPNHASEVDDADSVFPWIEMRMSLAG